MDLIVFYGLRVDVECFCCLYFGEIVEEVEFDYFM